MKGFFFDKFLCLKKGKVSVPSNVKYGLLYNFNAIINAKGLAPEGWHIPTKTEFEAFMETVFDTFPEDMQADLKLREAGNAHWPYVDWEVQPDNYWGFTLLPSGFRGYDGSFQGLGEGTMIVTQTSDDEYYFYASYIEYLNSGFNFSNGADLLQGVPVRCIRDSAVGWTAGDKVTDYDGNVYDTVKVGTQIWTVQNLAVTHYKDGIEIPEITDGFEWSDQWEEGDAALCAYNNNWDNVFI